VSTVSTVTTVTTDPLAVDALQRTLAAEHAAVFVLGALGGRASGASPQHARAALTTALTTAYDEHLRRRDQLRTRLAAAGADPVAAEPAYRLAGPLTSVAQIEAEALGVERSCATTYAALVAATSGPDRRWAVDALISIAVGEAAFGGRPEALPGWSSSARRA
jgi:hypothetical protein